MTYIKRKVEQPARLWPFIANFAKRPFAPATIVIGIALFAFGLYGGKDLRIGDLDPGAPELRPDSRYNLDNDFMVAAIKQVGNYGEIYERNLGEGTPFNLARGVNAQWTEGGLIYSPPFR